MNPTKEQLLSSSFLDNYFPNPIARERVVKLLKGEDDTLHMTPEEMNCIEKYLKDTDIMLEYGSGKSTLHFPKFVKEFHSVEHLKSWKYIITYKLSEREDIKDKVKLYFYNISMNEEKTDEKLEGYANIIDKIGIKRYDIILIDGVGRSQCCKKILNYIDKNSIVFIHDYYEERYEDCHWIEQYMDKIENIKEGHTMVGLRLK